MTDTIRLKITDSTDIPKLFRKIIRKLAKVQYSYPICIVPGNKAPILAGESAYYTNKSGDIVRHPNAYRRAFGKPIYHHSTRRIEVGEKWFSSCFSFKQLRLNNLKAFW